MTHLDDVASDLSVFHRIDDWETMDAVKFTSFAERLFSYRGALRDVALAEHAQSRDEASDAPPPHDETSGLPPAIEVRKAS